LKAGDGFLCLARKEVISMRTYEVRMFVPKVYLIEAKDDADVLEKIGDLYKELYQKDFRTWIEELPLSEPEDYV
jgi:hypothetical protein